MNRIPTKTSFSLILLFVLSMGTNLRATEVEFPQPKAGLDFSVLEEIAILDAGRQKPFDTFARETVLTITGRENFQGFNPSELLLSWLTNTQAWENLPIIKIGYQPLIEHLQLKAVNKRVSPKSLRENGEFNLFLESISARQQEGAKLNELERSGGVLGQRLQKFHQIAAGSSLNLYPKQEGGWDSLANLAQRYPKISLAKAAPTDEVRVAAGVQGMLAAYFQNDAKFFSELQLLLQKVLRSSGEKVNNYPSAKVLKREIHFNRLKPFRLAWIGYAAGAFLLALYIGTDKKALYYAGLLFTFAAFAIHAYGFVLRILISGRAPVTNMYETVIWIPFAAVFFGLILELVYRKGIFSLAAAGMAAIGLLIAESAPGTLDPAINPLVPVLRDNFWLTIHVLTITLSYGAFTLALGIANLNALYYIFVPQKRQTIKTLNLFIYRGIQIGIILLAAGTILGGVWANQSWGRFWGWDPKEVWALIALLGYLAILHGRYAGWIRGFGLTVSAILAYLLVLMAWYGVNFILGAGLHSYGFSSGGAKFVSVFTSFELILVALASLRYRMLSPPTAKAS